MRGPLVTVVVLVAFATKSKIRRQWHTECAKYHKVTNLTLAATLWIQHPRACILRSVAAVLDRAPDKDWDVGREMVGWGLGGGPVLLPHDDCGADVSDE